MQKDISASLASAAANATEGSFGSHTGATHSAGPTSTGQGTPPAPSMPVPQKPLPPITWDSGSGSPGTYGNDY